MIDGDARLKLQDLADGHQFADVEAGRDRWRFAASIRQTSDGLLHLRVVGQNSVIVNLPEVLAAGTELWLDVRYSGPVAPQAFDREAIQVGRRRRQEQRMEIPLQPRYLYSNRSYWYPQATVTDYATATIRVTVPNDYDVIATGQPVESPTLPPGGRTLNGGERPSCSKRLVRCDTWPSSSAGSIVSTTRGRRVFRRVALRPEHATSTGPDPGNEREGRRRSSRSTPRSW